MAVRLIVGVEALVFDLAATLHAGVLLHGYEHIRARNAEGVITAVLLVGLCLTAVAPRHLRPIAFGAQGFALLGTLVGLLMIAIGVGPHSILDLVLHATMLTLLVTGLVVARRTTASA
jgi:hypothetical protein